MADERLCDESFSDPPPVCKLRLPFISFTVSSYPLGPTHSQLIPITAKPFANSVRMADKIT